MPCMFLILGSVKTNLGHMTNTGNPSTKTNNYYTAYLTFFMLVILQILLKIKWSKERAFFFGGGGRRIQF